MNVNNKSTNCSILPDEILRKIYSEISSKNYALVLSSVSKQWRSVAESIYGESHTFSIKQEIKTGLLKFVKEKESQKHFKDYLKYKCVITPKEVSIGLKVKETALNGYSYRSPDVDDLSPFRIHRQVNTSIHLSDCEKSTLRGWKQVKPSKFNNYMPYLKTALCHVQFFFQSRIEKYTRENFLKLKTHPLEHFEQTKTFYCDSLGLIDSDGAFIDFEIIVTEIPTESETVKALSWHSKDSFDHNISSMMRHTVLGYTMELLSEHLGLKVFK